MSPDIEWRTDKDGGREEVVTTTTGRQRPWLAIGGVLVVVISVILLYGNRPRSDQAPARASPHADRAGRSAVRPLLGNGRDGGGHFRRSLGHAL